jgi:hypothetical protein
MTERRKTRNQINRASNARFGHLDFVLRACFGFRISSFGFPAGAFLRPIALLACIAGASCADKSNPTTRPLSARERQDQALRDPFGYGPRENKPGTDIPSVTGGSIGEFNRKEFDRDVDRVLNP